MIAELTRCGRLLVEAQAGQPVHEPLQGNAHFHARHVLAQAEMPAPAEGDVALLATVDVEPVGVPEMSRVAVGRRDAHPDGRSGPDLDTAEFDVLNAQAPGHPERRFESQ